MLLDNESKENKGANKYDQLIAQRTKREIKQITKVLSFLEHVYLLSLEKDTPIKGMKKLSEKMGINDRYCVVALDLGFLKKEGQRIHTVWQYNLASEPDFEDAAKMYDRFVATIKVKQIEAEGNNKQKFNHVEELSNDTNLTPEEKKEKVLDLLNWLYQSLFARPIPVKELGLNEKIKELGLSKLISSALFDGNMGVLNKFVEHDLKKIKWDWTDMPTESLAENIITIERKLAKAYVEKENNLEAPKNDKEYRIKVAKMFASLEEYKMAYDVLITVVGEAFISQHLKG